MKSENDLISAKLDKTHNGSLLACSFILEMEKCLLIKVNLLNVTNWSKFIVLAVMVMMGGGLFLFFFFLYKSTENHRDARLNGN